MTKFFLWRIQEIEGTEQHCTMSSYDTKNEAMMALRVLASILGKQVDFEEGTEFGGEPALWAWSVTDMVGGKYHITEELADEEGNYIDPIFG